MIYFVTAAEADLIKVGYSKDPLKRMAFMQAHSPVRLNLMGCVDGGYDLERRLHSYFSEYIAHAEWFHADPVVRETALALIRGEFDLSKLPKNGRRAWAWSREARRRAA